MKILHLFNEINYSGAEIMYANAAPLFIQQGLDLTAWSTGKEIGQYAHVFERQGIRVEHRPLDNSFLSRLKIKYYFNLYKYIKNQNISVLHIHRQSFYFVAFVAFIADIKCVKTQHNVFRNRWFTLPVAILRRFFVRSILNVTFQTIGKSVYENELKYYKNKSIQINNWFDGTKFFPVVDCNEKKALRDRLFIDENSFVIISTGMCTNIKNHQDIICAINLMENNIPIVYLHLGCGQNEISEKELAKRLGVDEKIFFLSNVENVRDYLVAADVFAMPSKFEGLGVAALEAMACGVPTILYDVPGLRDLISSNKIGFLIKPDYKSLAEQLQVCYEIDTSSYSTSAQEMVNSHYSMEANIRQITELYNSK